MYNNTVNVLRSATDITLHTLASKEQDALVRESTHTYLSTIAESFANSPDTELHQPPEYDADGNLILQLRDDTDEGSLTYKLIISPTGDVTRDPVQYVLES